ALVQPLKNDLRTLRAKTFWALQPEEPGAPPETKVEVVPLRISAMTSAPAVSTAMPEPPPIPQALLAPKAPQLSKPTKPPINWEQFMGAKLFAWIGGFPLFLGIAVFGKYSFHRNLIPPS